MLSGVTFSASEIAGTAVFRIVVSSDSMKNATATSHGNSRLLEADGADGSRVIWPEGEELDGLGGMESKNYFTNEYGNLLEYIAMLRIVTPSCWMLLPGVESAAPPLLVITCTNMCRWSLPFTPFLLR